MKLSRLIAFTILMFLLITSVFLYINRDYVVSIYKNLQNKEEEEVTSKYLELPKKDFSYIIDGKIFILDDNRMTAYNYEGRVLYERVLDSTNVLMKGSGNYIFFIDNDTKTMDVIDSENHLIMEREPISNINGIKEISGDIIVFSDDGLNFDTTIYDNNLDLILSFLSKDASVDLKKEKSGYKVLSLRRTENGLTTLLSNISINKEVNSLFELQGYVPLKFFSSSSGDIIATDKEVILIKDREVIARRVYKDFNGIEKINKNYVLIADGETVLMDDNLNTIYNEPSAGLDNIFKAGDNVLVYGGREFKIIGDKGIIKNNTTERDIEKIHYDNRIIVEFRNGFSIY